MVKYRKAYYVIEKALESGAYDIVLLLGLRRVGKTEILKQLALNRGGLYHDFRENKLSYDGAETLFDCDEQLLLLDEIGYLDSFDLFAGSLPKRAALAGKKVVITSSAYGALKQLGQEQLGAGRALVVELFPLSFEEYLHFSRDDYQYGDDYVPSVADVQGFYRLDGVPRDMRFLLDEGYMPSTFTDIAVARANKFQDERDVLLTREQYSSVIDILAYTLNDKLSMKRLTGAQIGKREFLSTKGLAMSRSLVGLANKIVNKMAVNMKEDIGVKDIAHIVAYLYYAGFLYVDLEVNENGRQDAAGAFVGLLQIETFEQFKTHFGKYNYCVISPLLYTRLLVDMEFIADRLYDSEGLSGELYELAVKSEAVQHRGFAGYHLSQKYKLGPIEVDLWERSLFLEASIGNKHGGAFHVDKVMVERQLVRVLTCDPKVCGFEKRDGYYRIGYPQALLMVSNCTMFDLEPTRTSDVLGLPVMDKF